MTRFRQIFSTDNFLFHEISLLRYISSNAIFMLNMALSRRRNPTMVSVNPGTHGNVFSGSHVRRTTRYVVFGDQEALIDRTREPKSPDSRVKQENFRTSPVTNRARTLLTVLMTSV